MYSLVPAGARGDDEKVPASARSSDPEALIRKGNELRQQGRNEEALPLFQAAYAAERTPRTAGQLGLSEMTVGYWAEAEAHLTEALEFPSHPWVAKNSEGLREMLRKAHAKIAEVIVDGSPKGAEVHVNGRLVGTLPLASPLRIGEGRIEVTLAAPNHKPEMRSLSVIGGQKQNVTINLDKVAPEAPPVVTQPARPPAAAAPASGASLSVLAIAEIPAEHRSKWPAIAAGGAGLVAFGFGVAELYRWQHAENSFNDHLGPAQGSPTTTQHDCGERDPMRGGPGCQSLYDEAVQARTLAIIGVATGAALAVTSGVLWLVDGGTAREQRVACVVEPVGKQMECRWQF
ncbi:MAG TPA: PEGA domain-containing protein [Polyangia bacterium]|nr:PEGA domain-containing protein [Polyangia bacterium]